MLFVLLLSLTPCKAFSLAPSTTTIATPTARAVSVMVATAPPSTAEADLTEFMERLSLAKLQQKLLKQAATEDRCTVKPRAQPQHRQGLSVTEWCDLHSRRPSLGMATLDRFSFGKINGLGGLL
jgi:hypothetical protein